MDVGDWVQLVAIMLLPTLLVAVILHIGPWVQALRRRFSRRRGDADLQPKHPPIEQLAADLRRLLRRYETVRSSAELPMRALRLRAVEGAIADCAIEAADALSLQAADQSSARKLSTPQLSRLLRALVEAGLMLPAIGLLTNSSDSRDNS
jgi:hypothetical protein